jgi:hypothetical protein
VLQLTGAVYLGFALTNWTARGVRIGGIYARPLSLGNCLHFVAGSCALLKYALASSPHPILIFVLAGYIVLAVGFSYLVFGMGSACVDSRGG